MTEVISMKKNILFLLMLLSLGFTIFSGCQSSQDRPKDIDEVPTERRIGVIKSLGGVKTSNQGTHLLQLDDGDTILLKSLAINLDDSQYLNNTVEVRGSLLYTTDGKQIMEVMNIDVLDEPLTPQATTPTWEDYASPSLGFSIKYRSDLDLKSENGVSFEREIESEGSDSNGSSTAKTKKKHSLAINREPIGTDETFFGKIGVKSDSSADLLSVGMTKSKIGSQSLDAVKKMVNSEATYFIQSDQWIYTVHIDTGNDSQTLDDQNLFYEMLSTFRLLDKEEHTSEADVSNNLETSGESQEKTVKPSTPPPPPSTSTEPMPPPSPTATTSEVKETQGVDNDSETSTKTGTSVPQETASNSNLLESETFQFGMQYPKSWYYSGSAGTEAGVVRHYDFGTEPIEEVPAIVGFDVMSGTMPSGSSVDVGGKTASMTTSGGTIQIYVQGDGSRYYRLSGPSNYKNTLLEIASTIQDK